MALDHKDLKEMQDEAYVHGYDNRIQASKDSVFYYIDHWGASYLQRSTLGFRGQFDLVKKAGRQILSDLASNPIQIDFKPLNESDDDDAEILDGLYRSDDQDNNSIWAYENAKEEAVVCGFGAWKITTQYSSLRNNSTNQDVIRWPIPEANNVLFWDSASKMIDRSDARYCSYIHGYTKREYDIIFKNMTGEDRDYPSNFAMPENSMTFPWFGRGEDVIYLSEFYYRDTVKDKILTMANPFGIEMEVYFSKIKEKLEELSAGGFEVISEKEVERHKVTQYIADGEQIIKKNVIVGTHIPIIPIYGEFKIIEGQPHYEGITRLAKDPQLARDFAMSYLTDMLGRSPRNKPIYFPEQIAGFEWMYEENGIDSQTAYLLQNRMLQGKELPLGPVGFSGDQTMPPALTTLIGLTKEAVQDVANAGIPQEIIDTDISGVALGKLTQRLDNQSYIYQHHYKYGKRRDAEVYSSIVSEIYDVPRKVTVTMPDNTKKQIQMLQTTFDPKTGETKIINDLRNKEFKVYASIGPDYSSQKEQTIDSLDKKAQMLAPNDPMRNALILKSLELTDGVNFDDIREYSRKQLILSGIKKPETPEEEQMLAQAQQQGQKPDPAMLLAQAEMEKAKADQMETQRKSIEMQLKYSGELAGNKIDTFDAQTKRMKVQVDAQKAGAEINMKNVEKFGKQLDNAAKVIDIEKMRTMSNDEIIRQFAS